MIVTERLMYRLDDEMMDDREFIDEFVSQQSLFWIMSNGTGKIDDYVIKTLEVKHDPSVVFTNKTLLAIDICKK